MMRSINLLLLTSVPAVAWIVPKGSHAAQVGLLEAHVSSTVAEIPSVSLPTSNKRIIHGINPLNLTPLEALYLAGVSVSLSRYSFGNAIAFSTVDKLGPSSSDWRSKLQNFSSRLTRTPRSLQLLYQARNRPVQENVQTIRIDPLTKQASVLADPLYQCIVQRTAYLIQEDLKNIREGIYPIPSELKVSSDRVLGPRAGPRLLQDFVQGYRFAQRDDAFIGKGSSTDDDSTKARSQSFLRLAQGLDLPEYYTDFHSVPGGFLSKEHAAIYDTLSETVFVGTFRMARRMMIRPIVEHVRRLDSPSGQGIQLLDLGTGTGTFLIQAREALKDIKLQGMDLSPAMLQQAEQYFDADPNISQSQQKRPKLERCNMESIPRKDGSIDIVTQSNCFHEMPEYAIRNTVKEIARVLKKEGLFVHSDALQMKDDVSIASVTTSTFGRSFHEPYIEDWGKKVDLDEICRSHGLAPIESPKTYQTSTVRVYRKVD